MANVFHVIILLYNHPKLMKRFMSMPCGSVNFSVNQMAGGNRGHHLCYLNIGRKTFYRDRHEQRSRLNENIGLFLTCRPFSMFFGGISSGLLEHEQVKCIENEQNST